MTKDVLDLVNALDNGTSESALRSCSVRHASFRKEVERIKDVNSSRPTRCVGRRYSEYLFQRTLRDAERLEGMVAGITELPAIEAIASLETAEIDLDSLFREVEDALELFLR